jgi:hypothetical protein
MWCSTESQGLRRLGSRKRWQSWSREWTGWSKVRHTDWLSCEEAWGFPATLPDGIDSHGLEHRLKQSSKKH